MFRFSLFSDCKTNTSLVFIKINFSINVRLKFKTVFLFKVKICNTSEGLCILNLKLLTDSKLNPI